MRGFCLLSGVAGNNKTTETLESVCLLQSRKQLPSSGPHFTLSPVLGNVGIFLEIEHRFLETEILISFAPRSLPGRQDFYERSNMIIE